jgi:TolB-like protein/Tfp pilus assembly protein PilF
MQLRQLIFELRRRRVLRAAAVYIVAAWVAVQVAGMLFPAVGVPEEALLYVWLIVASLFPLAVVFSWRYDVSLDGVTRTPPAGPGDDFDPSLRTKDVVLLAALAIVALSVLLQFGSRIEPGQVRLDDSISPFSIAVLPFDDLSGNPDEQYFISGMQSSLIDGLSRVRNLHVTSKVSTMPFRQIGGSILDVASQLGVARIVEGTVLRDGNRVSIALRMHDAERDQQVWSGRFEDELENIMILQAKAAQEIANQVRVQLGPEEREQFAAASPINAEAYQAYLKGVFHVERFNPADMRIAATHFQRAVEIDPDFALGHFGLAKLCQFQAQVGMLTPQEAREQCFPPVLRALDLDPFLPQGHSALAGLTTWQLFDWETARPHWERAVELNPSYAEAHMFYSHYLGIVGELEKSTEHIEKAVELDPLNPFVLGLYSIQLLMRDEYGGAIEAAEQAVSMAPGYAFGYSTLVVAHDALGNEEEAIRAVANALRLVGENPDAAEFLETAYQRDGYEAANLQLADFLVAASESRKVDPMTISMAYEMGGDYESSIDWLEISADRQDPNAPYIGALVKDPAVLAHPRFKALVKRMGLDYWASGP